MIDEFIVPRDTQGSRRIRLRAAVLRIGALLGWEPHEVIAFTEALTNCPWRRCSCDEFEAVLEEYLALGRVIGERTRRRTAYRRYPDVAHREGAAHAVGTYR